MPRTLAARFAGLAAFALVTGQPALAQQTPAPSPPAPSLAERLAGARLDFTVDTGRPGGAGWEKLRADAAAAQVFMIGEQHGTADIPALANAIHAALAPAGYRHAAIEVGPFSAGFAERTIRSGEGRLAAYLAAPDHALSIPFLFWKEETGLAEAIVARSGATRDAIWGLDQEFIFAGPVIADTLEAQATTAVQRDAVQQLRATIAVRRDLVGSFGEADAAPLRRAFAGNRDATAIIDALSLSAGIYAPYVTGKGAFYPANLTRENYMKRNFLTAFAAAEAREGAPPKVFVKLGANHVVRGFNATNLPAFGNFIADWGFARDFDVVNVMIDCAGGKVSDPRSGDTAPCEPYIAAGSPLAPLVKERAATLIDLKALRPQLGAMKALDTATREMILAFDYYLALRDVTAATPIAAPVR